MAANKATPNVYQLLPAILCLDPNIGINCIFQGCITGFNETFRGGKIGKKQASYTQKALDELIYHTTSYRPTLKDDRRLVVKGAQAQTGH